MTDNEIIKAFERWVDKFGENGRYERYVDCKNALDLINRQKAENERLTKENTKLKHEMSYMIRPNTIGDTHEMGAW
jgi:cell division protein FtsB